MISRAATIPVITACLILAMTVYQPAAQTLKASVYQEGVYGNDSLEYFIEPLAHPAPPGKVFPGTGAVSDDTLQAALLGAVSGIRASHARNWLNIKLPASMCMPYDTNSNGLQLDQWEIMHPSVVYEPDGFLGYRYWLAGTAFNEGQFYENPCLYVSNDNIHWSEIIIGTDTLHNPVFKNTGLGVSYLSDCELFLTEGGELWLFFRGKKMGLGHSADSNFIFGAYTADGIHWQGKNRAVFSASAVDTIIGPLAGPDCLTGNGGSVRQLQGFDLLSPAVTVDTSGRYMMWTVETGNYFTICDPADSQEVSEPNFVTLWEADRPEGPWDTVQTCQWLVSDSLRRDIWHLSVLPAGPGKFLALVTETNKNRFGYPACLHIAVSTDGGRSFTTRPSALLAPARCSHWADDAVYRSCGIWLPDGSDSTLGVYYSAWGGRLDDTLDGQRRWATGYGECFYDQPCQDRGNVDGIVGISGPIDIADLTQLVDLLFICGEMPPSIEQANVDAVTGPVGPIDVADMTYLIRYLFNSGSPPPPCR